MGSVKRGDRKDNSKNKMRIGRLIITTKFLALSKKVLSILPAFGGELENLQN
jgi:hypothetical protein